MFANCLVEFAIIFMKTLTLLTTISILFSSVGYCEKVDSIDFEKEFNHLIDGMYEVESWFDGNKKFSTIC